MCSYYQNTFKYVRFPNKYKIMQDKQQQLNIQYEKWHIYRSMHLIYSFFNGLVFYITDELWFIEILFSRLSVFLI